MSKNESNELHKLAWLHGWICVHVKPKLFECNLVPSAIKYWNSHYFTPNSIFQMLNCDYINYAGHSFDIEILSILAKFKQRHDSVVKKLASKPYGSGFGPCFGSSTITLGWLMQYEWIW